MLLSALAAFETARSRESLGASCERAESDAPRGLRLEACLRLPVSRKGAKAGAGSGSPTTEQGCWSTATPLPTPRNQTAVAQTGDEMYVMSKGFSGPGMIWSLSYTHRSRLLCALVRSNRRFSGVIRKHLPYGVEGSYDRTQ